MSEETARQAADRWLEYGQSRGDRGHREDAFQQSQISATLAVADEIAKLREVLTPGEGDREAGLQTVIGNLQTELTQTRTVLYWYARGGQSDGGERARRFLEEPRYQAPVESEEK